MCTDKDNSGEHIYSVDKEILEKTTRCDTKGCLSGDDTICPVERALTTDLLFVHFDTSRSACRYCVTFGDSFMCVCPVRQEIYRKYKE